MRCCLLVATLIASGCSSDRRQPAPTETTPDEKRARTALIRTGGSTTLFAAMEKAAEVFMRTHPDVEFSVTHSSSGQGLKDLIAGKIDIAAVARALKTREFEAAQAQGIALKAYQVAYDVLTIVVHPSKRGKLTGVSRSQLRAIFFEGTIRDWSQLHPELSGPITVYARDLTTSGSAETFAEQIMGRNDVSFAPGSQYLDSTQKLVPALEKDENGITFAPLTFVSSNVHVLAFVHESGRAVFPTPANISDLSYELRRDLFVVTRGAPKGQLSEFVQFLLSNEGQAIIDASGLVRLQR